MTIALLTTIVPPCFPKIFNLKSVLLVRKMGSSVNKIMNAKFNLYAQELEQGILSVV